MTKFTIIKREKMDELHMLYTMCIDNAYTVLEEFNGYSTIAQYSKKYDQIKIISVKSDNLDRSKRLQEG